MRFLPLRSLRRQRLLLVLVSIVGCLKFSKFPTLPHSPLSTRSSLDLSNLVPMIRVAKDPGNKVVTCVKVRNRVTSSESETAYLNVSLTKPYNKSAAQTRHAIVNVFGLLCITTPFSSVVCISITFPSRNVSLSDSLLFRSRLSTEASRICGLFSKFDFVYLIFNSI